MIKTSIESITYKVKVDRSRSPQEAIEAAGCVQYTDKQVVAAMPCGSGDEVEIVLFKVGRSVNDEELEKEYALRGLKPADPVSVAALNESYPALAGERFHGTHWKDANGKWCCATFHRWFDWRKVFVNRDGGGWRDYWWFAGVRK